MQEDPEARDERRAHARMAVEVEVTFESAIQLYTGLSGDISRGGVFIPTYQPPPIGEEVTLEVSLPNGRVDATGVVRWRREASEHAPPGIGIEFVNVPREGRDLLAEFCDARTPLYYDVAPSADDECLPADATRH